jgi:hypothetical protein
MSMISAVIAGVFVFLLGQLVLKCIIEPAQAMRATMARVSNLLLLYQAKLTNASCEVSIAEDMKKLSADIISDSYRVLWYSASRLIFHLPSRKKLLNAARGLNQLHYGMLEAAMRAEMTGGYSSVSEAAMRNIEAMAEIGKLLGVMTDYSSSPKPFLRIQVLASAEKILVSRFTLQRTSKPPDNPPLDHTDQTEPRR